MSDVLALHDAAQVRRDIDSYLRAYYSRQTEVAELSDPAYAALWQAMDGLAFAGGKRLRSYLTVLAYEIYGGKHYASIVPVAAAQELLHLSLLIHDDINDRDTVRYGVDNITGRFLKIYSARGADPDDVRHFADSAALLAGDLLLSAAHMAIMDSSLPAGQRLQAQRLLAEAVYKVAAGQLLDLEAGIGAMSVADTFKIARLKTASYSFNCPLKTGAWLAGAPQPELERLIELGNTLGLAYQLADDLLGVFGDESVTGKSNLTNLQEGKLTYLMQLTFDRASREQLAAIRPLFGCHSLTNAEAEIIRQVIVDCGARRIVEETLESQRQTAEIQLAGLVILDEGRQRLRALIRKAVRRDH